MFLFRVIVSLNYVVVSLKRRDLIPRLYLQLSEKYQKGISSYVTFMEYKKVCCALLLFAKNIFHLDGAKCEAHG